ncbi:MAG TPA: GDSL-type esterase/lipase family protein [Armatimonadota bacterium]|nr:GDSL-type esterase/lipase family protein [Armatimonadota bacterium]
MIRVLIITAALLPLMLTAASTQDDYPLRDAVESTARGGLPNFFAKLEAGEDVKIGYLGGSITAQPGWRPLTLGWFREQYPDATINEINAAIGGTGSGLGVFRLQHDVLQHNPDLLFVEFAVNDGGAAPASIHRSMEGIIRQTWRADPTTDICYVYTLTKNMLGDLQGGKYPRAASAMEELADHYQIPSIHMGLEVAKLEQQGTVIFAAPKPQTDEEKAALEGKILFSTDGVHPHTDTGHPLYLAAVERSMSTFEGAGEVGDHELIEPLVADNMENAKLVALDRATMSDGWVKLDPADGLGKRFGNRMPALWQATEPGESITFRFKGTQAGVYDLLGPDCGQLTVTLDDGEPKTVRRIDAYCTYHRLANLTAGAGLDGAVHTVTISVSPDALDKREILFERNRPDFDKNPAKYEGASWYAGAIMLIGDLVE